MAIIDWPDCAFITSIDWTPPDPPTQENESEWTGRSSITVLTGAGKWQAKVTFEPKVDEASALDLLWFRTALRGRANTFRLRATINPQFDGARHLQVDGGGQTGYLLKVKNGNPGDVLKRGMKMTINDQLVMNMMDAPFGDDRELLRLSNPLRVPPTDGTMIETVYPTALVCLADTNSGWTSQYPENFDFGAISVKERF